MEAGLFLDWGTVPNDKEEELVDMYPIFVELCGLTSPERKLEGKSITATLADPESAEEPDGLPALRHSRRVCPHQSRLAPHPVE